MLSAISKTTEKFVIDNIPAILTGVGVISSVGTAVLAGKAGHRSALQIYSEENKESGLWVRLDTKQRMGLTWKNYIPAVALGSVTVGSIVMAQRINMKRAAALAAVYVISEKKFEEYKDKVLEHYGVKGDEKIRDEIAQEGVTKTPPSQIILAGGDVLFKDSQSGRYFRSTVETIKQAQNKINYEMIHQQYATLTEFYEEIGLEKTSYSEEVGWNSSHLMEITFSAATTDNMEPCLVLDFAVSPTRGYSSFQ